MTSSIENRHVWVFREMRSGGTGFTTKLSSLLGKKFNFIEDTLDKAIILPSIVNNTHNFKFTEVVVNLCNPILIRVARKDKTEQMLSKYAIKHSENIMPNKAIKNIQPDTKKEQLQGFNELIEKYPITVKEYEVVQFAKEHLEYESYWKKYSSSVENITVYYEDLMGPVSLPILDLYNIDFLADGGTVRFPEYKTKLFTNYNQVKIWMREHYYEHCTKKYHA